MLQLTLMAQTNDLSLILSQVVLFNTHLKEQLFLAVFDSYEKSTRKQTQTIPKNVTTNAWLGRTLAFSS